MLKQEAPWIRQVDHIHIIKCYDSWIEDGEFYVCLELCDKGDLGSLIKQVCSERLQHSCGVGCEAG